MKIKDLVRNNIRNLQPYTSARSLFSGTDAVLLDANENGTELFGEKLNRYPDPLQRTLKASIAKLKKVPGENIFLGNGSDEAIDLMLRIFCEPGRDEIIICPPTYGMYKVQANIHGTPVKSVLLDERYDLRPEAVLQAVSPHSKLLFLCSPNNPTGNAFSEEKTERLLKDFPGIIVVDEAYGDFVADRPSWSQRLAEFPRLVVLQTFSKAWALAGVRLGMAFASEEIIHYLNSVKFPYNMSHPTQQAVLNALNGAAEIDGIIAVILRERERLAAAFARFPFVKRIFPSDANFLLVKMEDSPAVFQALKRQGIIVRDRSKEPLCEGCLRITVGTRAENDLLIESLKQILKSSTVQ